jgi:hypothetical protein
MTLTVKTGMQPEADIATAHFDAQILTGVQTVDSLQSVVPKSCAAIASFGLCGGLRSGLPIVGQTLISSMLVSPNGSYVPDQAWAKRCFAATHAYTQRWYSSGQYDQADTPAQRAALFASTQAWCIDDESLAVAQFAKIRDIPFIIVRTVSDAWNDNVAISSNLLNSQGSVNIWNVLKDLATDPEDMISMWQHYNTSIGELGTAAIQLGRNFGGAV